MLSSGDTVSLVMPARNESENVVPVLSGIPDWYDEIIVVDNRSTDGMAEKIAEFGDSRVRVITCDDVDSVIFLKTFIFKL